MLAVAILYLKGVLMRDDESAKPGGGISCRPDCVIFFGSIVAPGVPVSFGIFVPSSFLPESPPSPGASAADPDRPLCTVTHERDAPRSTP